MSAHESRAPETLLRETLAQQAADVVMPPTLAAAARARAHRMVVRRRALAASAAAITVAAVATGVALTVPVPHGGSHQITVASLLPDWQPRGTDTTDTAGIQAAVRAWDASTGQRHQLRQVLYAGRDSIGAAALLLATDESGQLRLGGLVGGPSPEWSPTTLVVDKPVTAPLVAASLVHEAPDRLPVLVVVTDPAFNRMTWATAPSSAPAMGDHPDEESLLGGVDILTFEAASEIPGMVTLSGPGQPDRQAPIG